MKEIDLKLLTCYHCGNKGLMKVEHIHRNTFGGPIFDENNNVVDYEPTEKYRWFLVSCPVCQKVTLYEECDDECLQMTFVENLYPTVRTDFQGVPDNICSSFESALKVKNIDSAICLLSLRRVLEAICKDFNAQGNNLAKMIEDLISKEILPDMYSDLYWIIRELGNSAAHADKRTFYMNQVEQTIEFVKVIIEYLYIIPHKAKIMKDKIVKENKS